MYVAKVLTTGKRVAIKEMNLSRLPRMELIVNEIRVIKELQHPNIVNFLESHLVRNNELWVVMEYMEGGALRDVIENNTLEEDQIACICNEASSIYSLSEPELNIYHFYSQTCKGLAHLHERNIIHRDIKSDHVLLDAQCRVKISKFTFYPNLSDQLNNYSFSYS